MKTTYLFLFFLLALFFEVQSQTLTPEQLQQDFDLFRKALHEVHPEMYRYTSRQTLNSLFDATRTCLNRPMSQQEFYTTMVPLIVALRDGHMKWIVVGKDQHYPFHTGQLFPLQLYFVEDQAWIVGNYGNSAVPEGAKIISVNGQPISSIVETLLPNISFADGYTKSGKYQELNHFFSGYYATFFGPAATFEVVYLDKDKEKTVQLAAVTEKAIKEYVEKHAPAPQQPFHLTYHPNNTAVMTIERFWDVKKEQDYKDFLKDAFRQLKEKQIQNLVLDVRNNEGGNEKYGILLYSYLAQQPFRYYDYIRVAQKKKISFKAWTPKIYTKVLRKLFVKKNGEDYVLQYPGVLKTIQPQKNAFTGELFVLVNGNSFSVTTEFAARVHADKRATFIGQETSGGYAGDNSGIFTIVQLPHSKIDMGIPMFGFHMANLPASIKKGQGIIPDHLIVPTAEDIINKHDRAMQFTLQLIRSKASK